MKKKSRIGHWAQEAKETRKVLGKFEDEDEGHERKLVPVRALAHKVTKDLIALKFFVDRGRAVLSPHETGGGFLWGSHRRCVLGLRSQRSGRLGWSPCSLSPEIMTTREPTLGTRLLRSMSMRRRFVLGEERSLRSNGCSTLDASWPLNYFNK